MLASVAEQIRRMDSEFRSPLSRAQFTTQKKIRISKSFLSFLNPLVHLEVLFELAKDIENWGLLLVGLLGSFLVSKIED